MKDIDAKVEAGDHGSPVDLAKRPEKLTQVFEYDPSAGPLILYCLDRRGVFMPLVAFDPSRNRKIFENYRFPLLLYVGCEGQAVQSNDQASPA